MVWRINEKSPSMQQSTEIALFDEITARIMVNQEDPLILDNK